MTVIKVQNQKDWADATLLKKSLSWMKERNDGRFNQAIDDEEQLLKTFFTKVKERGAASLSSAA